MDSSSQRDAKEISFHNNASVQSHTDLYSDERKLEKIKYYHSTNGYYDGDRKPEIDEKPQIISENEVSSTTGEIK